MSILNRLQYYQLPKIGSEYQDIKLYRYQEKMLKSFETGINTIVHSARQMGCSSMINLHAIDHCVSKPNAKVMIVLNNDMYIRSTNDTLCSMIKSQDWIAQRVKNNIRFYNGSEIILTTISGLNSALRSHTIDKLFMVDAAFYGFTNSEQIDLFINALSMSKHVIKQLIVTNSGTNETYNLFKKLWDIWTDNNFGIRMTIPYHLHPERNVSWYMEQQNVLGDNHARLEHNCGRYHNANPPNHGEPAYITYTDARDNWWVRLEPNGDFTVMNNSIDVMAVPEEIVENTDNAYTNAMSIINVE